MLPAPTNARRAPGAGVCRWRPFAVAALVYLALAVVQTWPLAARLGSVVPHDPGDPLMSTAILWWNAHVMPFTERWWNGFAFYPSIGSLALSDPRVGEGLIGSPLQWFGASPVAAYNVALLATYPLSALAAHALAFALTRRHDAATLAGLAYGFTPFRATHLAHLELLAAYGMPAALAALHLFLQTGRRKWLVVFSLALVAQGLSSSYYLLFFGVLLAAWLVWFIRPEQLRMLVPIALAGAAAGVVLLPQLLGYARIHHFYAFSRRMDEVTRFSADLAGLAAADPGLLLWGWTSRGGQGEGLIFPGLVVPSIVVVAAAATWRYRGRGGRADRVARLLLLAAIVPAAIAAAGWAFAPWRIDVPGLTMSSEAPQKPLSVALVLVLLGCALTSPVRRAWALRSPFAFYTLASVLLVLCSLGPRPTLAGHEFLYRPPYHWLMSLPAFDAVRVPARFAMPAMLAMATAAAIAVARLRVPQRLSLRTPAVWLLLAVAADGWLAPVPLVAVPERWPAARAAGFAAVVELPFGDLFGDLAAMYRATGHGRPLVNGSSGFMPGYYASARTALEEHDPIALDWLPPGAPVLLVVDRSAPDAAHWLAFVTAYPHVRPLPPEGRWWFWAFEPPPVPPAPCTGASTPIRAVADDRGPVAGDIFSDANPDTFWSTAGPQREGDSLTIEFNGTHAPCALELAIGALSHGYPRSLVVESADADDAWTMVAHVRTSALAIRAALADPRHAAFVIPLTARPATRLRLRLDQANLRYPWQLTELRVVTRSV